MRFFSLFFLVMFFLSTLFFGCGDSAGEKSQSFENAKSSMEKIGGEKGGKSEPSPTDDAYLQPSRRLGGVILPNGRRITPAGSSKTVLA